MYVYNPTVGIGPVKLTAYTNTEADGNLGNFTTDPDGTFYVNVTFYSATRQGLSDESLHVLALAID